MGRPILIESVKEDEFLKLSKVKVFLDSIERNSNNSRIAYSSGLRHLHNFIAQAHEQRYSQFNAETILIPLSKNEINVYELLDSFVSFILQAKQNITPKSVAL